MSSISGDTDGVEGTRIGGGGKTKIGGGGGTMMGGGGGSRIGGGGGTRLGVVGDGPSPSCPCVGDEIKLSSPPLSLAFSPRATCS